MFHWIKKVSKKLKDSKFAINKNFGPPLLDPINYLHVWEYKCCLLETDEHIDKFMFNMTVVMGSSFQLHGGGVGGVIRFFMETGF